MKKRIKLTESKLNRVVKESVKGVINELDWKTYANAAKKRLQQYSDSNHKDKEKFNKYWELQKAANQSFDDDYVGLMKYDTIGDQMKGKHSPKFDAKIDVSRENMPYSAIKGYNKSGNKLFSTDKGTYHSFNGITTTRNFFRDAEVSDAYTRANDELWDYNNGNYEYDNKKGWHLKESENPAYKKHNMKKRVKLTESQLNKVVKESVNRILNEGRGRFGGLVDMATEKFNKLYVAHKNEVDAHIAEVKTSGNFKDLETRLAWDIARATRYREWMPKDEQGYTVGTDAQLSTLFKQALRNSSIEY